MTDTPERSDRTETPDAYRAFELLRRSLPDDLPTELASPHAPAAQALLEEILSMPTTPTLHDLAEESTGTVPAPIVARPPGRGRRLVLAGAAALAVALATATLLAHRPQPSSPAPVDIETALAASSSALEGSGRATFTYGVERNGTVVLSGVDDWAFSGDDVAHDSRMEGHPPWAEREVGGEAYQLTTPEAAAGVATDDPPRWYHYADHHPGLAGWFTSDPRTLLDQVIAAGPFEELGTEPVDGVDTRHVGGTNPQATPVLGTFWRFRPGTVSSVEAWIDDHELVRRLDVTFDDPAQGITGRYSIEFSDLGEPVTVDAPADAIDAPLPG
jgi:hypothetical protein